MSLKSLLYSIFGVLLFFGLLVGSLILFGINAVLGIVGIVVMLAVTSLLIQKAVASANGLIDKLIAKIVVPVVMLLGLAGILLAFFLGDLI